MKYLWQVLCLLILIGSLSIYSASADEAAKTPNNPPAGKILRLPNKTMKAYETEIVPGVYTDLAAYAGTTDYYNIYLYAGNRLSVTLDYYVLYPDEYLETGVYGFEYETVYVDDTYNAFYFDAYEEGLYTIYVSPATYDAIFFNMYVVVDDTFEPNNSPQDASSIVPGIYSNLVGGDLDYYSVYLDEGEQLYASVNYIYNTFNVALYMEITDYNNNSLFVASSSSIDVLNVDKFVAPYSGYYYICVYPALDGYCIYYNLVMSLYDNSGQIEIYYGPYPYEYLGYGAAILWTDAYAANNMPLYYGWYYEAGITDGGFSQGPFNDGTIVMALPSPGDTWVKSVVSNDYGQSASSVGYVYMPQYEQDKVISTQTRDVGMFIARLYQQCLYRNPESGGYCDWLESVLYRGSTGVSLASGFVYSSEFINSNISNEDFVTTCYWAFFNRAPDAGGYNTYVSWLNNGVHDRSYVLWNFLYSQEYGNLCAAFGIIWQ